MEKMQKALCALFFGGLCVTASWGHFFTRKKSARIINMNAAMNTRRRMEIIRRRKS